MMTPAPFVHRPRWELQELAMPVPVIGAATSLLIAPHARFNDSPECCPFVSFFGAAAFYVRCNSLGDRKVRRCGEMHMIECEY